MTKSKTNRQLILGSPEFAHIKEALQNHAHARGTDVWQPIRETPLEVFFAKGPGSLENETPNPFLPSLWKDRYGIRIGEMAQGNAYGGGYALKETVSVPNSLSALKIADEILEGAEPYSAWKQYSRVIDMTTPKVNVPITKYTDTVGGSITDQKGIQIYKEGGTGTPPAIGGKVETVELDTSGTNNSYRGTLSVERNDVKDNNFLAVEQSLKNAGNEFYYMVGEDLITAQVAASTNTATKASLDSATPSNSELEALIQVIRGEFPGSQRNRADTMFIHPLDAALAVKNAGANGEYAFISRFMLGPTDAADVVNNSGLAMALGLRNVWETPQIVQGTVLITKRDINQVVGLREDLTIENFDLSVGGLYESDLVIRYDKKAAHADVGSFTITDFNV